MKDSAIYHVLALHYPDWQAPPDRRTWNACLCPNHDEERPSAAVSYELDAVRCQACGFKGNAVSILMRKEGLPYAAAEERAARLLDGGYEPVPVKPPRKPRGRLFDP